MPLRITIELIPQGDRSQKKKLAVVDIQNDRTAGDMRGNGDVGNYRVLAAGYLEESGWDEFADFTIGPLKRGDHVDTCIEIMSALHSTKIPPQKSFTGHIEVDSAAPPSNGNASAIRKALWLIQQAQAMLEDNYPRWNEAGRAHAISSACRHLRDARSQITLLVNTAAASAHATTTEPTK